MKALSIKQPWASLICTPREDNPALGIKNIENRTWKTNFRGRIYVHASGQWFPKSQGAENHGTIYTDEQWNFIRDNWATSLVSLLEPKSQFDRLSISAIIGEVDIIDCVINHESIWAGKIDWEAERDSMCRDCADSRIHGICDHTGKKCGEPIKPIYNWVLANPVLYEKPISAKGKLSFWEPDFDIEECIWCSGKFDYETMSTDGTENYCPECWKEAEPILQAEYDELKANGEID